MTSSRPDPAQQPDTEPAADEEIEIILRPPAVVAVRALILSALCRRAHLDLAPADLGSDDPEGERFDLAGWLVAEGLDPALTPTEQRLFKRRLGQVERDDLIAASWQVEGLAALAWALGLIDRLSYDLPIDAATLLPLLPSPWQSTRAFRGTATLRREAEIAHERERAELWHWRATAATDLAEATPAEMRNVRAIIREVAEEAHATGFLASPVGHDFPAGGRPYRDLDPALQEQLAIVAAERLRALNWLCGFGTDWDTVPLDV